MMYELPKYRIRFFIYIQLMEMNRFYGYLMCVFSYVNQLIATLSQFIYLDVKQTHTQTHTKILKGVSKM